MTRAAAVLACLGACLLLRLAFVERHGLWADEVFSLALATGHSLEHPAGAADPAMGDFQERPTPVDPAEYARLLEHETPAAGVGRVLRAVRLSDTSPPLYYLLLSGWTRLLGTSDAALRWFSVAWALASLPLLWRLARDVGGEGASLPALVLFAVSPPCILYSTEGRMYSLLWFIALASLGAAVTLQRSGVRPLAAAVWALAGAAGLLTHYFYLLVLGPACLWLLLRPGRAPRLFWAASTLLILVAALPWYAGLPAAVSAWRVTGHWLELRPDGYHPVLAALGLPWSYFSVRGNWGAGAVWDWLCGAVLLALAVMAWRRPSPGPAARSIGAGLLWVWVGGACLGVVLFDLLRGTYAAAVPRYALAGLPAAFVLAGAALGRLRPLARGAFLAAIVLLSLVGVRRLWLNPSRNFMPSRQVGQLLAGRTGPDDLVLVHSIPSGVCAVARYLTAARAGGKPGAGFAAWVGQLGRRRVPDDLQKLAAGRRRVAVADIHAVWEPAPEIEWLQTNAVREEGKEIDSARLYFFRPRGAETRFPED
jgi:4-amino-4-deoxy-L-arabinose transferase-like glycosyltransferase